MKTSLTTLVLLLCAGTAQAAIPAGPAGVASNEKPDITTHGITLNEKFMPGGPVNEVNASEASSYSQGKCVFTMKYHMINKGQVKTAPAFKNVVKQNNQVIKTHNNQNLKAGESKTQSFQVSLSSGLNNFELFLDEGNAVGESNESNNFRIAKIKINGSCSGNNPGNNNKPVAPIRQLRQ